MKKECIYCGNVADTKDHIPSKGLFTRIKGLQLITVPSCSACNKKYSLDEVFFRDHMSAFTAGRSLSSDQLFNTKIRRSILRRPALAHEMFNKMSKIEHYTDSGVYLGEKTAIKMSEDDWDRIFNILTKNIKGLFYHHFQDRIPDNFVIRHFQMSGEEVVEKHSQLLPTLKWEIPDFDYVFRYGYSKVPNMIDSIWLTDYFKNAGFMSFVRDPKNIK